ncbi:MAG: 6-phosphofructokinase, partial [Lautropia sp.]|nr:6-phosphofructokinase [Lautropia sp.]
RTFGFDSAVAVVALALARLETTARSHGRVMILETMGRYAGWIALEGGLAGGADIILMPEQPYDLNTVIEVCKEREKKQGYTVICIAEGARAIDGEMTIHSRLENSPDPIRLGGVANVLREQLQPHLESEVRSTQLGHVQRGGTPTPFDRVLATQFGWYAAKMVQRGEFGRMVVLKGEECQSVKIEDVANRTRNVPMDHSLVNVARSLGVSLGEPA